MSVRTLHPNTTQFPNVLLDHLLSVLSPSEWKALSYIVRRTYGWQRERERITYAQLEQGRMTNDKSRAIDTGTGLSRTTLTKALYVLNATGVLKSEGERTQARTYWLNLEYDAETVTDAKLELVRGEYDRKLESLQMRLPFAKDTDPPREKRKPVPLTVPGTKRPRTKEDHQRLLQIDLENVRRGRIGIAGVARRHKLPPAEIESMVRGEHPVTLGT